MRVGLYFGTFNPIHVGHLVIANYMADYTDLDQVWLVVTPQNPFKQKSSVLPDYHRLALVKEAIRDNDRLRASDIEFGLPQPNFTANTLVHLKERYPTNQFSLIMGEDNLRTFHRWKNHEYLLAQTTLYVYPRVLTPQEEEDSEGQQNENGLHNHPSVTMLDDVPVMRLSSSFIRQAIKEGKDVRYLLTEPVFRYVDEMNFYK